MKQMSELNIQKRPMEYIASIIRAEEKTKQETSRSRRQAQVKMEAICFSETVGLIRGSTLHSHRRKSLEPKAFHFVQWAAGEKWLPLAAK
jgi:hypothetical protein